MVSPGRRVDDVQSTLGVDKTCSNFGRAALVKPPRIVPDLLAASELTALRAAISATPPSAMSFEPGMGRHLLSDSNCPALAESMNRLVPAARALFESETLVPTYALFARYQGLEANLPRHKDSNACTYTIDLCLEQQTPWDIWVIDQPYTLLEGQSLAFYGTVQEHWRGPFPDPATNHVSMVFYHFVEPDHWWCTRGRDYLRHVDHLAEVGRSLDDPEQRLFMALLSRANTTAELYASVARRFPEVEPVGKVFEWVDAMTASRGPLGIVLNATMRRVARRLAEGRPLDAVVDELNAARRTPVTRADVERAAAELRESPLSMLFG
jgi:hypothetical protein